MKLLLRICVAIGAVCLGCDRDTSSHATKATPPAQVAKIVKEETLNTITLTPEAEQRLGITTQGVEKHRVQRTRTVAGELIVPLANTNDGSIYSLMPGLTSTELVRLAEQQADAEAQRINARVQVEASTTNLARAEALLASKSGSVRTVDEARAQVRLAEASLQAAETRRRLLGAPVFEAVNRDVLWVRTPIYAGEAPEVRTDLPAAVGELADRPGAPSVPAQPVSAPLSSTAGTATIDLFYVVKNTNTWRPGQKIAVTLPLSGEDEKPTVPWAAIIHDIHGGTWVYEQTTAQTYARRRVIVSHVANGLAALEQGPPLGAKVVTAGAAELFGTEVGFAK